MADSSNTRIKGSTKGKLVNVEYYRWVRSIGLISERFGKFIKKKKVFFKGEEILVYLGLFTREKRVRGAFGRKPFAYLDKLKEGGKSSKK